MQLHVIRSLFKKELAGYFANPTGYVFITLFVFLSGLAAFWSPQFFERNLANLDTLNAWFGGLLMVLVPAITMALWAEERKQGTDELLMTLPASDAELVLGKYLGAVAIYAVCLLFAGSHVLILYFLASPGRPDLGLMLATYAGYLVSGASLCAVGLAASSLSRSATIAFIAAALACGGLVAIGWFERALPGSRLAELANVVSLPRRLDSLNRGIIDPADLAYFAGVAALALGLCILVVRARRLAGARRGELALLHLPLRGLSLIVILACVIILLDRTALRADATAERLWTLSPQTRDVLRSIPEGRAIAVTAYVSPKVPESLVQQRETLLGLLREVASASGGRVEVKVVPCEPNSPEAREADRAYAIKPRQLASETTPGAVDTVFLGFAVTGGSGQQQAVTEFLGRGLSAEYELARAVRATANPARKKLGILDTPAELFGSFNFQTFQPGRDWPIVAELRRQFDVAKVAPGAPIPPDIDALIVGQPSALSEPALAILIDYLKAGRPALILEDPMPLVRPDIATAEPRLPPKQQFGQQMPQEAKANIQPLWDLLHAKVGGDYITWDLSAPHPNLGDTPPEFIWVARASGGSKRSAYEPFNESSPITSGLQECVLLFPGRVERLEPKALSGQPAPTSAPEFASLLKSPPTSRAVAYANLLQRSPFGFGGLNPARKPAGEARSQTLAARISGGEHKLNVVLVSDLDAFSETFFSIREAGAMGLEFDNITFVLNAIDALASDEGLVDLRKRRRAFRTLERIEARRAEEAAQTLTAIEVASTEAESKLAEARARFDASVSAIEKNPDLDETTKRIQAESIRQAEQRKLDAVTRQIEDEKQARVEDARLQTRQEIERIQMSIRLAAVALPPIPALAIGAIVFVRRRAAAASSSRAQHGSAAAR